ncbi:MAG: transposase [Hymenobacter sp.]
MYLHPGQLHHLYNRGNNGEQVFYTPAHYQYFLRKVRAHLLPTGRLLAYCLMPNHFHLLFEPAETDLLGEQANRGLGLVLASYAQGLNQERRRTGSLFQKRTKAKPLEADPHGRYPLTCLHYLHQNPLRVRLVARLADWPYSSYRDYAGLRHGTLCALDYGRQLLDLPRPGLYNRISPADTRRVGRALAILTVPRRPRRSGGLPAFSSRQPARC